MQEHKIVPPKQRTPRTSSKLQEWYEELKRYAAVLGDWDARMNDWESSLTAWETRLQASAGQNSGPFDMEDCDCEMCAPQKYGRAGGFAIKEPEPVPLTEKDKTDIDELERMFALPDRRKKKK
jgi:hypothetical protein